MIIRVHIGDGWVAATRWTSHLLLGAGVIAMAGVLWSAGEAMLYQTVQADRFDALIQQSPSQPPSYTPAEPSDSTLPAALPFLKLAPIVSGLDPLLIGRLEIPRLGLTAMVREGVGSATLRKAVGHVPGSALPGAPGNFVVAGHRDSFFRGLRLVQTGDEIRVRTRNGAFRYHVRALSVVDPTDVDAMQPTVDRVCTLVTCFPFDYVGPAPRRFIVRADLILP
jgi:sortase A